MFTILQLNNISTKTSMSCHRATVCSWHREWLAILCGSGITTIWCVCSLKLSCSVWDCWTACGSSLWSTPATFLSVLWWRLSENTRVMPSWSTASTAFSRHHGPRLTKIVWSAWRSCSTVEDWAPVDISFITSVSSSGFKIRRIVPSAGHPLTSQTSDIHYDYRPKFSPLGS